MQHRKVCRQTGQRLVLSLRLGVVGPCNDRAVIMTDTRSTVGHVCPRGSTWNIQNCHDSLPTLPSPSFRDANILHRTVETLYITIVLSHHTEVNVRDKIHCTIIRSSNEWYYKNPILTGKYKSIVFCTIA